MKNSKLNSVSIALEILKREKREMSPNEIIDIAFKEYGVFMKGKTPIATLNSNFINERKRRMNTGKPQRFIQVKRGRWGLVEYLGIHYDVKE